MSDVVKSASLSEDERYRYTLGRRWGWGPLLGWVMLNPSTADDAIDDPTIRRCMGFARDRGYGGIYVVNLFALRATDPAALLTSPDPYGPHQRETLHAFAGACRDVVVAWGAHSMARQPAGRLAAILAEHNVWCLGTTKDGSPRHPLYVRADQPFVTWPGYPEVSRG